MATNVSERIHTLQDVLDALSQQASAATSDPDFDPREDMGEALYLAGQLMAIARTTATISAPAGRPPDNPATTPKTSSGPDRTGLPSHQIGEHFMSIREAT